MTNHTQNNQLQIRSDELIMRGQELEDIGKLDEAEEYYLQAVKIAPNPTKAHLNLGNIYLSKDDPVTATEQYRLSLKYDPNNGSAYANLGRIDLLQNNYSGAVNHFMRGTKLLSGRAKGEANVGLGFALTKLNQNKQAEQALREAIGIVPKHPFANLHLGRLLMISGKSVDAAEHLNIAVKELPNNWNVHSWLGKVFADQGFIL
ncbi:MAG: tetratricopeptide repeat protein, partial [Candidatus Thiodiazotropha sp.]